jgi:endoribonuclease LACTB2
MDIFNVGYKSINLYLIASSTHRLLIDSGFPNSLNNLGREMRKTGFKVNEIDFLIVTHFHIDHAGAIQELKNQGVKFILFDIQQNNIKPMENMTIGKWQYTPLLLDDNIMMKIDDSVEFLKSININGQIIKTAGHTDDSISLVLDSGECFIGDLLAEYLLTEKDFELNKSWQKLKQLGIKEAYPSHGGSYEIQ